LESNFGQANTGLFADPEESRADIEEILPSMDPVWKWLLLDVSDKVSLETKI
jgi:hypothetical protein